MSEEPDVSDETPEKPVEAVTDEELDDVAGGGAGHSGGGGGAGKAPLKDPTAPQFASFPPDFLKVMSYREPDAATSNSAGRSVSEIFDNLAADE